MTPDRVPKLCGADIELGNFVLGAAPGRDSCAEASRALLREIDGVPSRPTRSRRLRDRHGNRGRSRDGHRPGRRPAGRRVLRAASGAAAAGARDEGRVFLPTNGGCAYIDLDHLELCLPEVVSAHDHVAAWHAMLRLAQRALADANARRSESRRIVALVNNSDGRGHSYGSHLDFLVTRTAWDDILRRKLHHLAYLAAFQASSIVFTGQGKVGSENGAPPVSYQISQRADFFEELTGPQTTYDRPLVNGRDEPLCGARGRRLPFPEADPGPSANGRPTPSTGVPLARLHCIFFDNTLCPVASLLKVGTMQIALAMLEAGRVDPRLALDDPLDAVRCWSHDPDLRARAPLVSGRGVTAVELQTLFLEAAEAFVATGGCAGVVPGAEEILRVWGETLQMFREGDRPALARRIDWVLKQSVLERVLRRNPDLGWDSPEIKHLDHLYSSLDPEEGLYWAFAAAGGVEPVVDEASIERFLEEPPADTRAWGRAMLLRRLDERQIDGVDWHRIRVRTADRGGGTVDRRGGTAWRLELDDPLGWNRAELAAHLDGCADVEQLLATLGAQRRRPARRAGLRRRQERIARIDHGGGDEMA